jgi:hypothetical protein
MGVGLEEATVDSRMDQGVTKFAIAEAKLEDTSPPSRARAEAMPLF